MSNLEDHMAEQSEITAAFEAESLDDMQCPKCGQTEVFHIAATVWGAFTAQGFDMDAADLPSHDNDWNQYAACMCPKCQHTALVEDFSA